MLQHSGGFQVNVSYPTPGNPLQQNIVGLISNIFFQFVKIKYWGKHHFILHHLEHNSFGTRNPLFSNPANGINTGNGNLFHFKSWRIGFIGFGSRRQALPHLPSFLEILIDRIIGRVSTTSFVTWEPPKCLIKQIILFKSYVVCHGK